MGMCTVTGKVCPWVSVSVTCMCSVCPVVVGPGPAGRDGAVHTHLGTMSPCGEGGCTLGTGEGWCLSDKQAVITFLVGGFFDELGGGVAWSVNFWGG